MELTKVDILAMQQADDSVLIFHSDKGKAHPWLSGVGTIRCSKRIGDDVYKGSADYIITVESRVVNYVHDDERTFDGYAYIGAPTFHETWKTAVALMRVGDVVSLLWIRGNDSINLTDVGLTHDDLHIVVKRGKKQYTFHVMDSVTKPGVNRLVRSLREVNQFS